MKGASYSEKKDDQFAKNIDLLKKAEADASEIIKKANEKSEAKIKASKEKADEILNKTKEEAIELKNRLLFESRKKIETEQTAIIKKALEEAETLEKKRLKPEYIKRMAASVFE